MAVAAEVFSSSPSTFGSSGLPARTMMFAPLTVTPVVSMKARVSELRTSIEVVMPTATPPAVGAASSLFADECMPASMVMSPVAFTPFW